MSKRLNYTNGIIAPVDLLKNIPFGGESGFLGNLVREIKNKTIIFGMGANGNNPWVGTSIARNAVFMPIADVRYPSKIPHRLKSLFYYLVFRKRILRSNVDLLYIHSWECALPEFWRYICSKTANHLFLHRPVKPSTYYNSFYHW